MNKADPIADVLLDELDEAGIKHDWTTTVSNLLDDRRGAIFKKLLDLGLRTHVASPIVPRLRGRAVPRRCA